MHNPQPLDFDFVGKMNEEMEERDWGAVWGSVSLSPFAKYLSVLETSLVCLI